MLLTWMVPPGGLPGIGPVPSLLLLSLSAFGVL
jgi:hypothetical protein